MGKWMLISGVLRTGLTWRAREPWMHAFWRSTNMQCILNSKWPYRIIRSPQRSSLLKVAHSTSAERHLIQWCLQWQATSLCVTMHADSVLFCRRRGWNLTLNGPRLNPMLILQHRQLPRWGVGWQVLVVNHGNASHSASPPAPSKPVSVTSTNDPLSAPMDKDDTTPMPSPVVMPPQAQLVNPMSIISHVPEWSLGTLMHALGNDMVDNSTPPAPVIPPKADAILLVAAPPQGGKLLCHLRLTPSSLR